MRQKQVGFSLIELLIVVAIILIIAAIAIPSYLRSRLLANEASTAESLRAINTAEVTYSTTYGTGFDPLPFFPDPLSRGAALRDLPGTPSGVIGRAIPDTGSKARVDYNLLSDPN